MEAFLISAGLVALAEIGDKTQLLAIVLAARFGRPVPILLGILAATIANHGLASAVGVYAGGILEGPVDALGARRRLPGLAAWTLIPDKLEENDSAHAHGQRASSSPPLIAFFLVEMGDKTQVATIALAARFQSVAPGRRRHHRRHDAGQCAGRVHRRGPGREAAAEVDPSRRRRRLRRHRRLGAAGRLGRVVIRGPVSE